MSLLKHTFQFRTEWRSRFSKLTPVEQAALLEAILNYVEDGVLPGELSDKAQKAFVNISADLNNSQERELPSPDTIFD